jgi:hypothetical protein
MSREKEWQDQGDYQVGRIDGKSVVLARGGTFTSTKREDLPLWVMATCRDADDAARIVAALKAGSSG